MVAKFDLLVEVKLKNPEDFLKVKETLTRIGIASSDGQTLYQSCHIFHKRGQYAIVHFKEMFDMDGKSTTFTQEDRARRNAIIQLLIDWKLIEIMDKQDLDGPMCPINQIKIIPFRDKHNWKLVSKYSMGKKAVK